eukprot:gnl/MRDRNA2_/MRDRNA2_58647_c0_seq1.p1 gnl/MRDRNA2_/MRDRNA2_58647_c0~~gnl/MRDRNA2_/MRDRNA2_58647_c0_seq1.p1  ORF type:complete len:380 (+),score=54.81 gnl/MRDRNA2_/MRDRNA2_58647_c0_seq1:65-1204(+)
MSTYRLWFLLFVITGCILLYRNFLDSEEIGEQDPLSATLGLTSSAQLSALSNAFTASTGSMGYTTTFSPFKADTNLLLKQGIPSLPFEMKDEIQADRPEYIEEGGASASSSGGKSGADGQAANGLPDVAEENRDNPEENSGSARTQARECRPGQVSDPEFSTVVLHYDPYAFNQATPVQLGEIWAAGDSGPSCVTGDVFHATLSEENGMLFLRPRIVAKGNGVYGIVMPGDDLPQGRYKLVVELLDRLRHDTVEKIQSWPSSPDALTPMTKSSARFDGLDHLSREELQAAYQPLWMPINGSGVWVDVAAGPTLMEWVQKLVPCPAQGFHTDFVPLRYAEFPAASSRWLSLRHADERFEVTHFVIERQLNNAYKAARLGW